MPETNGFIRFPNPKALELTGYRFEELCSNSVYAVEGRAGVLTVRLEHLSLDQVSATRYDDLKASRFVRLGVADNGMGMEEKIQERIFDPYFTTKEVDKGLGLGLAVVYGIAKKYGGSVRVTSEIGKGTCVEVLFPSLASQPERDCGEAGSAPVNPERILFIDTVKFRRHPAASNAS